MLDAIRFVLLVLPIACDARKRPQYDFLVYNASVTYWQIARQLMKPATFQFLAPSLTKIIEALRSVGERDVLWVATLQLTLVSAQLDAKQFANAAKTVNDLVDVQLAPLLLASGGSSDPGNAASSDQVRALYDAALRAQVHVGSMKDVECQKIVPNVKKIVAASTTSKRASLLVKLQCLKSGNIDKPVDAAYTEIIQEATGFAAFSLTSSPNTSDEELMNAFLHSLDAKSIDVIDADVIVETGLHAAFSHAHDHDELRVAHCCDVVLQRKGKSLAPHFRVLHQVLKAVLLVVSPLTSHHGIKRFLDTIERQSVILVRRMEAIKVLERALLAAKRQEDPNLVESVCVYAWNVALPLLQPHLRGQLSRVLTLSASLLEEMDSLLLVLRARLHLEISKVEIKSEFLSKAYESVNKALVLDYGASIAPAATIDEVLAQEQKITTRPVDPHLVPLKKKLQWKLDIEDQVDPAGSPQTAEKHIRALIESAKETKDTGDGLRAMLRQAAELLAAQVAADGLPENVSPPRLESLAVLWVDVCKMAWEKLKDGAMAEQLAKQGLDVFFISASATHDSESPLRVDKSLRVLEIDFRTVLTEILAAHIKNRALQLDTAKNQQQHIGKATRLGTRSKAMERKEKPASEIELSALKLLSEDTFVLGMHQPHVNVQAVSNGEEAGDAEAIQSHAKTIEDQVLGMKKEIVQHLVASLTVAGQIGWRFVLENTCVYLWNYHFQLFRMLATKSSHSFNVQLILPECTAAFEAAYAALEAFPERDGELLACNALGLSSIYEAMARWDKVLVIADTFLKRKASSIAVGHGAVSSIHLMRFAELKTRAQLSQNAKEISPGEIASPFLKVVAYLEALEMSFQQQPQSVDKCQTYYQKALTLWQSIAGEWIAALTTTENNNNDVPSQTLEKVQQQTEIYVELWTRVAYGALRLQQFRFVVECANQALEVLPLSSSLSDAAVLLTTSAWRWLAASEILCGRAILALGNGDKTSKMLVLGSLRHLVHAAEYANRARASSLVVKASEVVWNVSLMVLNNMNSTPEAKEYEPTDVKHVIGMLRTVLQFLSKAEAPCYGDLVLLTLALCEKAGEWVESCAVCEDALTAAASGGATRLLSIKTLNEISTASAISAAKLGKTSGGSGGGVSVKPGGVAGVGSRSAEQQDPLLKAKILKKIAFSSMKDPPAQLKALSSAYTELDGRPEEQAVLLIDMAEWFFTSRVSSQDAEMYLDNAARVLLASEALKANPFVTRNSSRTGISGGGGGLQAGSTSVTTSKREEADIPVYSALWMNEKLIRVFVMRAMTATSCSDRWGFIEKAAHCVDRAWQSIVAIINEMELQEVFGKVAAGATPSDLDFDEWKCSQKLKYSVPRSSQEWLEFYLQYAKSTDARFYMEWTNKLQVIQNSATATSVLHFTDPVLTGFYLEKLLTLLQEDMADELLLPTVCLYQVLYFGYSATKTRIMELWLELTLFNILERHNLAACALPLQSALEIFQMHGKLFVEELQTQGGASSGSSVGYVSKGVCRPVLESTSVNLRVKMASSIELLLRFGYVRQGKTGLEIMKHTLRDADNNRASQSEISILSALVHEIEGNANVALGEIEAALQNPSLDLQKFVRWTIHYCELSSDSAKQLKLLKDAEKLVASWLISTASEGGSGGGELGRVGELDVFLWIAQLKFKQATMSLRISPKRSGDESQSDDADDAQSRQVFSECIQILTHVDAKAQLSRFLVQYSQELLKQCAVAGNRISRSDVAHAVKSNLQRAISEMTAVRLCMNEFYERRASASTDGVDAPSAQVATTTVLGIEIALAKSLLASVELTCELSADVVTAHEITWYAYEADSKRNIVEKWLCQTSKELQQVDGGNLGAAIVLATAANTILSSMGGLEEHTAMTAAQVLQCRRLALYHHEDKMRTKKYIHKIWTRFTSSDSPHATWVCCGNSTSSATSGGQLATESSVALVTAAEAQENDHMDAFLSDFVHQMQQFQKLALEKRRPELLRVCSLELMQVYGCQRPLECIRSLLLYQSITASVHMRETFQRSVAPRDGQQLHLRRLERLQEMHVNASKHSLPYQLSLLYLEQQSAVFKRMSVTVPTETILASLPPHVRILSLQFSPDKCFLYCALVASGEKQYAMARMECTEPVMVLLTQTQERVRRWRSASAKLLTEFEELHAGEADFEFASTDSLAAQSLSSENDELEKEFSGIIVDTIDFLAPLFGHSALQSVLHSEIHGAAVTLLLDRDLECLPVEALPVLEKADCIARDFSLHVLYQRLQTQKAQPFKRDDMRFIVDPYHDDTGLDAQTMETVLHQHVKRPGATFSSWKDAVEHGQPPTTTDWQHALLNRRGGGLFYLGANRILGSSLSMSDLLGMSTALNCHVVCLLDRADNQASARRQSKVDSEKQSWQLAVEEDAYANAMLWSLAGVNVLVMNQYATTFNGNRRLANGLFAGLAKGFSIGKALKKYGELVSPSGAMNTAPPSTASSTVSSSTSLPPANSGSAAGSNTSSTAGIPAADTESTNSSNTKLHNAGSRSMSEAVVVPPATVAGTKSKQRLKHRLRYNTVVYGLAHVALKSAEQ